MKNLFDIFRTLYINFKVLPFKQAIKLPIEIRNGYKVVICKSGGVIINNNLRRGLVVLGGNGSPGLPSVIGGSLIVEDASKICFSGSAYISSGTSIRVESGAQVKIGNEVYINSNCYLRAESDVTIGDECILGWNVTINTTDGHYIYTEGEQHPQNGTIVIGNHCWIGNTVSIAKGVLLASGCVCAQYSLVNKSFPKNSLIGGIPAKLIKEKISWNK